MEEGKVSKLESTLRELVRMSKEAQGRAYAPYSHYKVGCVLVDSDGSSHSGCNVENASYSVTLCAERVALGKMISDGGKRIVSVILITSSDVPCFPCGSCLQALIEFTTDADIIAIDNKAQNYRRARISEVFPEGFSRKKLNS